MTDLGKTIIPKSDQVNSDDLINGPMTIRITRVSANESAPEQPISIFFEGDNGKPYKPCKSMRRVMVHIWGSDGSKYPGRAMTLYRDPSVKWGGLEVGGIRISHMSDMDEKVTIALTATKQSRKPYTVQPLIAKELSPIDLYGKEFAAILSKDAPAELAAWWTETAARRAALEIPAERLGKMEAAYAAKTTPKQENSE